MDEFGRIARLRKRLAWTGPSADPSTGPDVRVGIGDDAAVLAPSASVQVLSVDTANEHIHFEWSFGSPAQLTQRAVVAALSDLAAMGARPRACLMALSLAPDVDDARFDGIVDGLVAVSEAYRVPIVGGNLSGARDTAFTTTVVGECAGRTITRTGARVGDIVYVTGPVGGSALGLAALLAGRAQDFEEFADCWRAPRARVDLSEPLSRVASAAIDISDGLVQDLGHLCEASQVSATVEFERVPLAGGLEAAAGRLGADPLDLVLAEGDVYELLFTAPPDAVVGDWATPVGRILAQTETPVCVTVGGAPLKASFSGFSHFRTSKQDS
ncbi:MAG: thiamine-phosphate kinase [Myxococcales bacterium]|nr:thiamine-phosphate kinase [Myxococcales bacterium]